MSNWVDFFEGECRDLAVPAGRCEVFVEGEICTHLEVVEIVRAGWPQFGWAKLKYNPAAHDEPGSISIEKAERTAAMGKRIDIYRLYDAGTGEVEIEPLCVFAGQVEGIEKRLGLKEQLLEITVKDLAARLDRVTIHGRRVATTEGESLFLDGSETVFNEDNLANASKQLIKHNCKSYTAFAAEQREAKYWTLAEAIIYLLSEYVPFRRLQIPSLAYLEALTDNEAIDEFDVEGKSLLDALQDCCEQGGVDFCFMPRQAEVVPRERIVFYRPGCGRRVELNCQDRGEQLSISKTNICELRSRRDYWPVTHRYIGKGGFKVYEATFDLVKAWDPSLEGGQRADYSPSTNEDFDSVRDVYRKWCLNESGDYTGAPYNQGTAFDFSQIFETAEYVQKRRWFEKSLSTTSSGQSLGYYLEVSYDSGTTWEKYTDGFDVLSDECGIWLSDDGFSDDVWNAAVAGTLWFRITAAVTSDERLMCEVADGPVNSVVDVINHVMDLSSKYKFCKVSGKSIFHKSTSQDLGVPDEVDNTQALMGYVRSVAKRSYEVIETIDVETPIVATHYEVGDRVIPSPDSRNIIGVRSDNRSIFWIERVAMDFEKQSTNLKVLRRRGLNG